MMRSLATLVLLSAAVPAQQVCVRGLVEPAGISICFAGFTHMFSCGNLKLRSSVITLKAFEGQVVELCGTVSGQGTCRMMDVNGLTVPVDSLVISGPVAFRIGRGQTAQFDLGRTPGRLWVTVYSDRNGFTDLGPTGVFQLDARFFPMAQGLLDAMGQSSFKVPVPNDAALVNVWLYFQPAFIDLATLTAAMGNADCFQIQ